MSTYDKTSNGYTLDKSYYKLLPHIKKTNE